MMTTDDSVSAALCFEFAKIRIPKIIMYFLTCIMPSYNPITIHISRLIIKIQHVKYIHRITHLILQLCHIVCEKI